MKIPTMKVCVPTTRTLHHTASLSWLSLTTPSRAPFAESSDEEEDDEEDEDIGHDDRVIIEEDDEAAVPTTADEAEYERQFDVAAAKVSGTRGGVKWGEAELSWCGISRARCMLPSPLRRKRRKRKRQGSLAKSLDPMTKTKRTILGVLLRIHTTLMDVKPNEWCSFTALMRHRMTF